MIKHANKPHVAIGALRRDVDWLRRKVGADGRTIGGCQQVGRDRPARRTARASGHSLLGQERARGLPQRFRTVDASAGLVVQLRSYMGHE